MNSRPPSEDPLEDIEFQWPRLFAGHDSVYSPLIEYPDLYIVFSNLKPDSRELQNFKGKFGELTLGGLGEFESLEHLLQVKLALDLDEAIREKTINRLRPFIRVTPGSVQFRAALRENGELSATKPGVVEFTPTIAHGMRRPALLATSISGDLERPVKTLLGDLVNRGLGAISPVLVLAQSGELEPRLRPNSLISAIWYQVYELVAGRKAIRRCELCGRRMDVTERRSHKRVHDHCSKRERMRRLRAKGKTHV
jgi:hypothetical protein